LRFSQSLFFGHLSRFSLPFPADSSRLLQARSHHHSSSSPLKASPFPWQALPWLSHLVPALRPPVFPPFVWRVIFPLGNESFCRDRSRAPPPRNSLLGRRSTYITRLLPAYLSPDLFPFFSRGVLFSLAPKPPRICHCLHFKFLFPSSFDPRT